MLEMTFRKPASTLTVINRWTKGVRVRSATITLKRKEPLITSTKLLPNDLGQLTHYRLHDSKITLAARRNTQNIDTSAAYKAQNIWVWRCITKIGSFFCKNGTFFKIWSVQSQTRICSSKHFGHIVSGQPVNAFLSSFNLLILPIILDLVAGQKYKSVW